MQSVVTAEQLLAQDLRKSGLEQVDLDAYLAQEVELAAVGIRPHLYLETPGVGTPGYVIPYFDINGNRAPYYRVKLFQPLPKGAKYLQPQNSGSWVYYPKNFAKLAQAATKGQARTKVNGHPAAIILTEGEKKAAKACADGFPACAVGGVFNWRSRTIILPEDTQLLKNRENQIVAKTPPGTSIAPTSDRRAVLASGLEQLMRFLHEHELQIVIAFDSDNPRNLDVERAAAELAFEFRIRGIPTNHIRQLVLPTEPGKKIGLDDFLYAHGPDGLDTLLEQCIESKTAFPAHPNLKEVINQRMDSMIGRTEAKELSLLVLTDMDRHGQRMIEKNTGSPYFFDSRGKRLLRVNLLQHHSEPLHETKFGEFMYKHYDISQADSRLLPWVAAGFTGEKPVIDVEPRSILAVMPNNKLAYQIDDGHFVVISGDSKMPIRLCENGTEGLLFRADQVEPVDYTQLYNKFKEQVAWLERKPPYTEMFWPKALSTMKFVRENDAKIMAILSYLSPWLLRWNGAQLPVELLIGEPGSGKSSLYGLRLRIIYGWPALRNQSTDIRDWYASVTSQDGIHVVDNVHLVSKELRQRLSDEMCRIVTEPTPYVEMRKLFTTSDNFRLPVRTVFAMTAIQQPFLNADILQRSLIIELAAVGKDFSSSWDMSLLKSFGGRVGWLAHHLAVIHLFFRKVSGGAWNPNYKSGHRLAHFEQMFRLFGNIIGVPDAELVGATLAEVAETQVSEYDWTMEALKSFNLEHIDSLRNDPNKTITLQDVASWAMSREEYAENTVVTNARRLSRYIKQHKYMVEKVAGFMPYGRYGNRDAYRLTPVK